LVNSASSASSPLFEHLGAATGLDRTGVFPTPLSSNFTLRKATSNVHTFTWRPSSVLFQSTAGGRTYRWSHTGPDVPVPGDETPRINLWLYEGKAPTAGALSVVVRGFSFTPLA